MWKFLVKNQSIEIIEREVLADHQIQYVQFKFAFDGDWKRFHKVVQFTQCDDVYSVVLGTEGLAGWGLWATISTCCTNTAVSTPGNTILHGKR